LHIFYTYVIMYVLKMTKRDLDLDLASKIGNSFSLIPTYPAHPYRIYILSVLEENVTDERKPTSHLFSSIHRKRPPRLTTNSVYALKRRKEGRISHPKLEPDKMDKDQALFRI
jgi:hypothetical protein